jgi:AraC-like DNA-binding protein
VVFSNPASASAESTADARGLVGDHARQWIALQGWEAASAEPFQLSAKRLGVEGFSVARIWTTPTRARRQAVPDGDSVIVLVGVDGASTVRAGADDWVLGPRKMIIADTNTSLDLIVPSPAARLEVVTQRRRLGASRLLLRHPIEYFDVDDVYWKALSSLVITILSADVSIHDPGFVHLRASVENTVTAAVVQSPLNTHGVGDSYASILVRAKHFIEERFVDPHYSTAKLACELSISRAHLHRVFSSASAKPYQLIQEQRANRAADLLAQHEPISDGAVRAIASESGFTSTAAMRRALKLYHATPQGAKQHE